MTEASVQAPNGKDEPMQQSHGQGRDGETVAVRQDQMERLLAERNWQVRATVCKWFRDDIIDAGLDPATARASDLYDAGLEPSDTVEMAGNALLNEGINEIWQLVSGSAAQAFNNANARIGVGNGTAAATASQTGLQGTSTSYQGMATGFPSVTNQTIKFEASWGSGSGSFAWEEWSVDNGTGTAGGLNMNRKVASLGTKSGGTWTLTVSISLS